VRSWGEPFGELEELQQATSQLLERVLSGRATGPTGAFFTPHVDIEETDDAWIVEAELPGVSRDDVNVEVRDDELAIFGEIKRARAQRNPAPAHPPGGPVRVPRHPPGPVSADDLSANLSDGVLTVRVPKPEAAHAQRIEVQSGRATAVDAAAEADLSAACTGPPLRRRAKRRRRPAGATSPSALAPARGPPFVSLARPSPCSRACWSSSPAS
jgi:HSP20 family protein